VQANIERRKAQNFYKILLPTYLKYMQSLVQCNESAPQPQPPAPEPLPPLPTLTPMIVQPPLVLPRILAAVHVHHTEALELPPSPPTLEQMQVQVPCALQISSASVRLRGGMLPAGGSSAPDGHQGPEPEGSGGRVDNGAGHAMRAPPTDPLENRRLVNYARFSEKSPMCQLWQRRPPF
jgi:hypothetical protein